MKNNSGLLLIVIYLSPYLLSTSAPQHLSASAPQRLSASAPQHLSTSAPQPLSTERMNIPRFSGRSNLKRYFSLIETAKLNPYI
ncbi:MAG: hypothetical protein AAFQ23_13455 [Cyanobacteria bacterium J06623_1]